MKRTFKIALLAALLIAVGVMVCVFSVVSEYTRTKSGEESVTVVIPQGASDRQIAEILEDKGVINHTISFRLKMKKSPYSGKLMYGKFMLKKEMCLDDVITELLKPQPDDKPVKLTIPEGFSAEMIALRCEELGIAGKEEFLDVLSEGEFEYDFIKDIPENEDALYKLQGYLFPSTYLFDENSTAYDVINTLLGEFETQYNAVKEQLHENMTMHEAIIRASLIEREAKLDEERVIISGVIQNRINEDMPLQLDASALYSITEGLYDIVDVTSEHMREQSAYNTYLNKGLTPGPICNPGIKCILAAMNPQEHSYLYYHTDTKKNDGSHIFTENYDDHRATME